MRNQRKEFKKPKTAADKGKRYRCCICRKKAARKVKVVPHYCEQHAYLATSEINDY